MVVARHDGRSAFPRSGGMTIKYTYPAVSNGDLDVAVTIEAKYMQPGRIEDEIGGMFVSSGFTGHLMLRLLHHCTIGALESEWHRVHDDMKSNQFMKSDSW